MATVAARAGAQQVFDVEYLSVETVADTLDSFEPEGFEHFLSLRPMVALRCVW